MRGLLIAILIVGLGYVFLRQKQNEKADRPAATPPVPVAAITPAPAGQASEYNYMKRSLDRARTVRDQSRAQTQAAQEPN